MPFTGTDEHGLKVQQIASKNSSEPKQFCDLMSQKYLAMVSTFNISANQFIRTTSDNHLNAVSHFWKLLDKNGFIYKQPYSGWYCVADETFIPEHEVVTNHLGERYNKSGHRLEWYEEDNYMFRLSHFQDNLKTWLQESEPVKPLKFNKIAMAWLNGELTDISISRPKSRLNWGIDVPGDSSQVIYVWLDALVNYLTSTGYPKKPYYWPPSTQIVGKDILKFHAIYWPAFLMAAGISLPSEIVCHSHWVANNEKMSKSKGNTVDPFHEASAVTVEGLRYFLLKEGTLHSDANYNHKKMVNVINSELADTLGNLLSRSTSIVLNKSQLFTSYSQEVLENDTKGLEHIQKVCELPEKIYKEYSNYTFYRGLEYLFSVLHNCSAYFQFSKPWELKTKTQQPQLDTVLFVTLETLRVAGIILQPIIPQLSSKLLDRLNIPKSSRRWHDLEPFQNFRHNSGHSSHPLGTDSTLLFKRIILKDKQEVKQ